MSILQHPHWQPFDLVLLDWLTSNKACVVKGARARAVGACCNTQNGNIRFAPFTHSQNTHKQRRDGWRNSPAFPYPIMAMVTEKRTHESERMSELKSEFRLAMSGGYMGSCTSLCCNKVLCVGTWWWSAFFLRVALKSRFKNSLSRHPLDGCHFRGFWGAASRFEFFPGAVHYNFVGNFWIEKLRDCLFDATFPTATRHVLMILRKIREKWVQHNLQTKLIQIHKRGSLKNKKTPFCWRFNWWPPRVFNMYLLF